MPTPLDEQTTVRSVAAARDPHYCAFVELAAGAEALTARELAPVVRRALADDDAWPTSWSAEPLSVALANPATTGLYRVSGTARAGSGRELPWAVVLKIVGDVDLSGSPLDSGYLHDLEDWNYWKREVLVHRCGVLDTFPGPLVGVRCLGITEPRADQAWIWMEALDGARRRRPWSLQELALAAHDVGAFSAQGTAMVNDLAGHPWVTRRWLRGWVRSIGGIGADHAAEHADCWRNPVITAVLPRAADRRFAALRADTERLLSLLESLPVTVAHHDAQWSNLFRAPDSRRTVAIDWSFLGLAPVGQDLGHHIGCNIFNWAVDPRDAAQHDAASSRAYLHGLKEFGWQGDDRLVALAKSGAAALQIANLYAAQVSWLCTDLASDEEDEPSWPEELATLHGLTVEEALTRWGSGFGYLLDMGDEARRLAETLG